MNEFRQAPDEWQALGEQWRGQAVDAVDVDALRVQVRRRGRRLRGWLALEIAATALGLGLLGWVALASGAIEPAGQGIFAALAASLVAWQGWSLWIRRRQLGLDGLDAAGMLALEIERARTTVRYWRWGMWAGIALWLLVIGAVMIGTAPDSAMRGALSGTSVAINAILFGLCGVFAWWCGRRCRARIRVLEALRAQLER